MSWIVKFLTGDIVPNVLKFKLHVLNPRFPGVFKSMLFRTYRPADLVEFLVMPPCFVYNFLQSKQPKMFFYYLQTDVIIYGNELKVNIFNIKNKPDSPSYCFLHIRTESCLYNYFHSKTNDKTCTTIKELTPGMEDNLRLIAIAFWIFYGERVYLCLCIHLNWVDKNFNWKWLNMKDSEKTHRRLYFFERATCWQNFKSRNESLFQFLRESDVTW